jgi:thioredoxin-related protein
MRDLSAVGELKPHLREANINFVLLSIHDAPGKDLLKRFGFRATPTFILYDSSGEEVWRAYDLPSLDDLLALVEM